MGRTRDKGEELLRVTVPEAVDAKGRLVRPRIVATLTRTRLRPGLVADVARVLIGSWSDGGRPVERFAVMHVKPSQPIIPEGDRVLFLFHRTALAIQAMLTQRGEVVPILASDLRGAFFPRPIVAPPTEAES